MPRERIKSDRSSSRTDAMPPFARSDVKRKADESSIEFEARRLAETIKRDEQRIAEARRRLAELDGLKSADARGVRERELMDAMRLAERSMAALERQFFDARKVFEAAQRELVDFRAGSLSAEDEAHLRTFFDDFRSAWEDTPTEYMDDEYNVPSTVTYVTVSMHVPPNVTDALLTTLADYRFQSYHLYDALEEDGAHFLRRPDTAEARAYFASQKWDYQEAATKPLATIVDLLTRLGVTMRMENERYTYFEGDKSYARWGLKTYGAPLV